MAIFGKIEDIEKQLPAFDKLKRGFDFLKSDNIEARFEQMGDEKKTVVKIDGDDLFAIFEQYQTKDILKPIFEGHKKYTDIQYIFEGEELMHVSSLDKITQEADYQEDRDIYFPKVSTYSTIHAVTNSISVFFSTDLHAPGNCIKTSKPVKKVVIKVAL